MSNEERPVPTPRPRQIKSTSDEIDSNSNAYENFTIKQPTTSAGLYEMLNDQLKSMRVEMERPSPAPRTSKPVVGNYENTTINNNNNNNNEVSYQQPILPPKTGAIRKTSNIPKVDNNLNDKESIEVNTFNNNETKKDDELSVSSTTSEKSNEKNEKYVTPSPT